MHNWEHPVGLYHHLVRQLHRHQPQGSPEGGGVYTMHHWGQTTCPPWHLQHLMLQEGQKFTKDNNQPRHCLLTPLPSRRRGQYRCIKAGIQYRNTTNNTERLLPTYGLKSMATLINVSLVTLNNATLIMFTPYITHLICIYCTLYHLLHLAYAARPSLIHLFIGTYSYSSLYICVYKVVVVNLLDYLNILHCRN